MNKKTRITTLMFAFKSNVLKSTENASLSNHLWTTLYIFYLLPYYNFEPIYIYLL